MQMVYLLPLTALALLLAVGALGFRASRRRGYGPFALGLAAAVGLVMGKFVVDSDVVVYASIAALVAASLWNSWPKKSDPSAPTETLLQLGSIKKES
jgi:mercuric ion transport protein